MTTHDRIKRAISDAKVLQDEAVDIKKVLTDFVDEVKAGKSPAPAPKDPS